MGQEVTREELLERVQQIAPVVREHADQGEQQRHLADPIVEAIREAGLYQMLVPRELGGLQVDPLTFYLVVEALAWMDGSTGWCMFITAAPPSRPCFCKAVRRSPSSAMELTTSWQEPCFLLAGR